MSESEIIQNVLSGNRNAFAHLVDRYKVMVFNTCMGFVHNKDDADDITQEVFIHAYQSLPRFKGASAFSTWLYRIALNVSLNFVRNNKKLSIFQRLFTSEKHNDTKFHAVDFLNPEQILISEEQRNGIRNAIDSLPDNQRIALILSKYHKLPQKEIAEIMQTTEGAVESLIFRGKARLKQRLLKNA